MPAGPAVVAKALQYKLNEIERENPSFNQKGFLYHGFRLVIQLTFFFGGSGGGGGGGTCKLTAPYLSSNAPFSLTSFILKTN